MGQSLRSINDGVKIEDQYKGFDRKEASRNDTQQSGVNAFELASAYIPELHN